jgi:hypothetical protein
MLGVGTFGTSDYYNALPAPLWFALVLPENVLGGAVPASYALFWLLFPAGVLQGWRRQALYVILAGFGIGIGLQLAELFSSVFPFNTSVLERTWFIYNVLGQTLGVACLAATYLAARGFDRRLFGWLLVVDGGIFAAELLLILFQMLHPPPPRIFEYIFLLGAALPLVIAYAIVRYQMFDVEYVLSRTIAYSTLAVVVAGLFVAVDVAFAEYFNGSRVELALDVALALALGFGLRSIHRRSIDVVDRLLFARRYDTRIRLKAAYNAVSQADSVQATERIVTSDAATALGLASAVFFRHFPDGGYLRETGYGWACNSFWNLLPDDKLASIVRERATYIDLRSIGWSRTNESPPRAPAFAVPMRLGETVMGVTFYGDRLDGILLSPDDINGLVDLSSRCAERYALFSSAGSALTTREMANART